MRFLKYGVLLVLLALPAPALAHCPLCTAGIGVVAVLAAWLGVSTAVIGIFIGALAVAIGFWVARLIRRNFIPGQRLLIVLISFLTTVLPIAALMPDYTSLYLPFVGEYGRTIVLNEVLMGGVVGAFFVVLAPSVSRFITHLRHGALVPYQGVLVTVLSLVLVSLMIELLL